MLPQSSILIMAPVVPARIDELRRLLDRLNHQPGLADPANPLVPFGRFDRLHLARLMILEDPTPDDIAVYGLAPASFPASLAVFADCDGSADAFLGEFAQRAEAGLRQLFGCCHGFGSASDVLDFMRRHRQPSAADYVNWIGRTVRQIREEAALHDALAAYVDANAAALAGEAPQAVRQRLLGFVTAQRQAGAITLTPPEPTPAGWFLGNLLHLLGVPLLLILASPFLLLYLPFFLWQLRRHETADPEILPRPDPARRAAIAALEDHDVTNPYIVCGYLKPGLFRLSLVVFLLWLVDYGARHIYNRGHLARVQTIHFARWVFLNGRKQMFFASNYDGSLESYMDDFINKVGWGLNLLFSNGVGYPRTDWLISGGASDEQKFKYFIHRHQIPVQVWYKAYPGLTAVDLLRNARLRDGFERSTMSDAEIREWLGLL
ncbi:MAG TPA: hypothetical protein VET89_06840 [Stellaceae bacterium]|nr:hypothetical protein [Stellaceae bacterium]